MTPVLPYIEVQVPLGVSDGLKLEILHSVNKFFHEGEEFWMIAGIPLVDSDVKFVWKNKGGEETSFTPATVYNHTYEDQTVTVSMEFTFKRGCAVKEFEAFMNEQGIQAKVGFFPSNDPLLSAKIVSSKLLRTIFPR